MHQKTTQLVAAVTGAFVCNTMQEQKAMSLQKDGIGGGQRTVVGGLQNYGPRCVVADLFGSTEWISAKLR